MSIKQHEISERAEVLAHEYLSNESARMHHVAGMLATGAISDRTAIMEIANCLSETLAVLALLQERNDVLR